MYKFFRTNFFVISFLLIPVIFLWHPNWLGILGTQPYWPLFWLLPWSMINGSYNGSIVGFFLGLILDAISFSGSFTQIPGLILCGIWFGKFSEVDNVLVGHFRYGLICCIGSLLCGSLIFMQLFLKEFSNNDFFLLLPSVKNIFTQVFLTGFLAPFFCSQMFKIFKNLKEKKTFN